MVGQVPSSKTGLVVGKHRIDRTHRVYYAMGAGNLPHPVQDAAYGEIGSKLNTGLMRVGRRHLGLCYNGCERDIGGEFPLEKAVGDTNFYLILGGTARSRSISL